MKKITFATLLLAPVLLTGCVSAGVDVDVGGPGYYQDPYVAPSVSGSSHASRPDSNKQNTDVQASANTTAAPVWLAASDN